jgi:Tol biopolymer transport system component
MNDAIAAIELGRRIDLTRQPDFMLGDLMVIPTALARAGGEVVSRKSLVEVCWGDVVVGDDALNRCIQSLRRLSQEEAQGAFAIETVPRLGYRMSAEVTSPLAEVSAPAGIPRPAAASRRHWAVLAGGLVAVILLAVTANLLGRPGPPRWSIERSEPLVSTPLIERHPALSPDGTMIAYSAGPDLLSRHIYLKRLSGGEPIQLTSDGLDDVSPTWSHDGSRIAYSTFRPGEPCRIMVVPVPAGLATQLGRCRTAERSQVLWSPSANNLFFLDAAATAAPYQIFSLDLASGLSAPIDHPTGGFDDTNLNVSPDGRLLLFARTTSTVSDNRLVIRDVRTGRETWLAHVPPTARPGAWAQDSESVFVTVDAPGGSALWWYPIDGGPGERLLTMPFEIGRLSSGPGGLLAAEYNTGRFNVATRSATGSPQIIDPANGVTWSPAFAPDGTLAMGSNRAGDPGVWLMRSGGHGRLLLRATAGSPTFIAWSPSGASFAYVTNEKSPNVDIASAAGEELGRIRVPGTDADQPAWTADGRSLVFPVRDARGWRIWRADLGRPDRPRPVTGYGWESVRTDGDVLYGVRSTEPGIWRIGPPAVKLTDQFDIHQYESWSIFRDRIIFADPAHLDHPRLLWVPLGGGPERLFADLPNAASVVDFAINPRTGVPVYVEEVSKDSDIELLHLARR